MTEVLLIFDAEEIAERDGARFQLHVDPREFGELGAEFKLASPVAVTIEFSVGGSQLLMACQVSGKWDAPCSRCLAPCAEGLSAAVDETYPIGAEKINAKEDIRQAILLSMPVKPLCRQDCKGICALCGKNKNQVDCDCAPPRTSPFSKLKQFKKGK